MKSAASKIGLSSPPAPSTSGTTGSTQSAGTVPPPASSQVHISVKAIDSSDVYARTWSIFTSDPGSYQGGGQYSAQPAAQEDHTSGDTMSVSVPSAPTMWLAVTQSGGSNLGTYAGAITVNGGTISFSGVDADHSFKFSP